MRSRLPLGLLLVCLPALANTKFQGYAERGGAVVVTSAVNSTTKVQQSFPGATVTVRNLFDNSVATIYSNSTGTALANPFTADSTGYWSFFASDGISDATCGATYCGSYSVTFSGLGVASPFTWASVTSFDPKDIPSTISDQLYLQTGRTFYQACTAAVAASRTLLVSGSWTAIATGSCAANLQFYKGGVLQPASAQTVTLTGSVFAPPNIQIIDLSASGTVTLSTPVAAVYPQWFGALADDSHDDTAAIQAAADTACRLGSGCLSPVVLPGGTYKTTAQLSFYHNNSGYNGFDFSGVQGDSGRTFGSVIDFRGSSSVSAIRYVGLYGSFHDFTIYGGNSSAGWLDGLQYDGIPGQAISTDGRFESVRIDCGTKPGNAFTAGRSAYQADQATFVRVYFDQCYSGSGLYLMDSNAVGFSVLGSTIDHNWIGVRTATSAQLSIHGGEIDENNLNFFFGNGPAVVVSGIRTEGAIRQVWNTTSGSENVQTFVGNTFSGYYQGARASVTATGSSGSGTITLSASNTGLTGFTFGDHIVLDGNQYQIVNMSSPLSATVTPNLSTSPSSASVTLDATVQQDQFELRTAGPYTFLGNFFNSCCGGSPDKPITFNFTSHAGASYTFQDNTWAGCPGGTCSSGAITPFGTHTAPGRLYLQGNAVDNQVASGGPFAMTDLFPSVTGTFTPDLKFCSGAIPGTCANVGMTYVNQSGYYTKTGDMISVSMQIDLSALGSSTGTAVITGLPYALASLNATGSIVITSGGLSLTVPAFRMSQGNTYLNLYNQGATGIGLLSNANFGAAAGITVTITYR